MTVVAWDGETLAADKASNCCGYQNRSTKIYRLNSFGRHYLVGFAGNPYYCMEMLNWLKTAMNPATYPEFMKTPEAPEVFTIDKDGVINVYGQTPYPQVLDQSIFATGSGRDYALAAMHLGKTSVEAVELASKLDASCGRGFDTLTLEE